MHNINWITFAVSNTLSKSVIHFLPTSNTTNAPYPVTYTVSLFGNKLFGSETNRKSVTLDDGRLGQPDGVRLEDIFPALTEVPTGLLALSIELSTIQPKVDLSASSCVVEIMTASNSVRFFASNIGKSKEHNLGGMLAVNDAYNTSSLMLVNCSDQLFKNDLLIMDQKTEKSNFNKEIFPQVEAYSAYEYSFVDKHYSLESAQECSWGLLRSNSISFADKLPDQVVAYAIYRDTLTKRIVSVKAL